MTDPSPFPRRRGGFVGSFAHALRGLVHTLEHQRNMRVHLVCAVLVGLVGSGIPLGLAEKVTLLFCVLLVFFAEILNSAIEQLVDLAIREIDPRAKAAKDAGAAGVLVLSAGTVAIFACVLAEEWATVAAHRAAVVRQAALGVPLAACVSLLLSTARKPRIVDGGAFALGGALLWQSARASASAVFTAMTIALFALSAVVALARRRGAGRGI